MTFIELMKKYLTNNAMSEEQANEVIKAVDGHKIFEALEGRLNEDVSAYPDVMQNLCLICVKVVAIEYIDLHCPQAWFRTVFLPVDEQKKLIPEAFK